MIKVVARLTRICTTRCDYMYKDMGRYVQKISKDKQRSKGMNEIISFSQNLLP